jgi:sugar lactone lactonase YvrE
MTRHIKHPIAFAVFAAMIFAPSNSYGQFVVQESDYAFAKPGFLASPGLMAYDYGRHRLAIVDEAREAIIVFDLNDGTYQSIETDSYFKKPAGLAFARNGNLFITHDGSRAIRIFSPELTASDSAALEFSDDLAPGRITVADNGDLYILDLENRMVCQFDSDGIFIRKITEKLRRPDGIAVGPSGEVFVADKGVDPVLQYSTNGKYVRNLSRPEDPTGQESFNATGLAFDQRGWIYTIDATHNKLVRYDPTGVSREEWSPEPPFFPKDIVIDKYDNVYVSESGLGNILMLGIR